MTFRIELNPEDPVHRDIKSYSVDRMLWATAVLDAEQLRRLAHDTVYAVTAECVAAGAKDVSHVKLFIEHSSGFLHANSVSGSPQITVAGRDGSTKGPFRLVMNAVIFGLREEAIATSTEQALGKIEIQYGLKRTPGWSPD
jgi:hypothetical protein